MHITFDYCSRNKSIHYSEKIPQDITENKNKLIEKDLYTKENTERAYNGLEHIENGKSFKGKVLTRDMLHDIASKTNSAGVHSSGNCALIANCVLKNLEEQKYVLAAKNISPFYQGLNADLTSELIFGRQLRSCGVYNNLKEMEESILQQYNISGNRFFLIETSGYQVPFIGDCGHAANAVVLFDENSKPYVQIVDGWKTWGDENVPSHDDFSKRYSSASSFEAKYLEQ